MTEEFIERSCPSFLHVPLRFLPKKIKPSCSRVRVDLTVPRVVEIDLGEFGKKLIFCFSSNRLTASIISTTVLTISNDIAK